MFAARRPRRCYAYPAAIGWGRSVLGSATTDDLDEAVLLSVLSDVKSGDFSARMPLDWTGVAGKVADRLNDVITANQALGIELARVSRVVGKEGKLSQRVALRGSDRVWSESVESVNSLIDDLVRPTSEMQRVIGAVADGDLSKKVTADVHGEMLELKNTINAMVDQLNGFVSEVTRVAREVGTEGKLGQAAAVTIEVGGVWKDLTDNVNLMAGNLTGQVRNIAEVTTAVANGDLSKKISADVKGEFLELKNTVNAMVDQLNAFASEVTRVAREVGRRGQARRPGAVGGGRGRLEGPDRQRQPARGQPHQPGAGDRRRGDGGDRGRPDAAGRGRGERRGRGPEGQAQRDDPQPARDDAPEHRAGLAEDQPRALHPHAPGPARPGDRLEHDPLRARAAGLGPARRLLHARRASTTAASRCCSYQAGYGYKERKHLANHFRLGEGLVGQCAQGEEADPAHRGARRLRAGSTRASASRRR